MTGEVRMRIFMTCCSPFLCLVGILTDIVRWINVVKEVNDASGALVASPEVGEVGVEELPTVGANSDSRVEEGDELGVSFTSTEKERGNRWLLEVWSSRQELRKQ